MPQSLMPNKMKLNGSRKTWNAKIWHQEIPGVTGKFGLVVQNEIVQILTVFCPENPWVIANTHFQQQQR